MLLMRARTWKMVLDEEFLEMLGRLPWFPGH